MSHHTYKYIELTGSSEVSSDDAVKNAIESAAKTTSNMAWFEVVETRGHLVQEQIQHWQVTVKIGFRLED